MKNNHDRISQLFIEGTPIDKALQKAVQKALWEHKQLGHSICIWRDGQVVLIPPEEIQVEKPAD